jgi:aspartate--ammonia ligase
MGIRVNQDSLYKQVMHRSNNQDHKLDNDYAKQVLNNELPLTIGGGIGQSRLCMFFLKKMHIGEVQVSIWKEEDIERLSKENIKLL